MNSDRPTSTTPRKGGKPLYEVVARTLHDEIRAGIHPVGGLLPTEAELRQRFSVSRHTVREALRRLRDDRLVSSRQGSGTVVESPRRSDEFVIKAETINDLVAYSSDISLDLESIRIEAVTGQRAVRAGISDGEQWLVAKGYITGAGSGLPICWAEHFINLAYRDIAGLLPHHRGPVFRLIEDAMGLEIVEIEQEITGQLVPAELAAALGVEPASAAIQVKRIFGLADRAVAQITLHTHPASRVRYATTMQRSRG